VTAEINLPAVPVTPSQFRPRPLSAETQATLDGPGYTPVELNEEYVLPAVHHQGDTMSTTHEEAEAAIRVMETWFSVSDQTRTIVAWWREHVQPAVPAPPEGCELVEVDGVPVFRAPTEADYGWLRQLGLTVAHVGRYALPSTTSKFNGKRYIVRQVTPPVPTDVERLARLLADREGFAWDYLHGPTVVIYVAQAQRLYDLGVRCPEQTP